MAYFVLVIGETVALDLENCFVDFKPEATDYRDYDLVIDLGSEKIVFPITGESSEFSSGTDLSKLIRENLQILALEEFDKKIALDMLAGSEKLYQNSLQLYYSEYRNLKDRLEDHFKRNEFQEMRDLVHKIRGYALYTGAKLLQKVAGILETELMNGEHNHYSHFLRLHERLLAYCQVKNV